MRFPESGAKSVTGQKQSVGVAIKLVGTRTFRIYPA